MYFMWGGVRFKKRPAGPPVAVQGCEEGGVMYDEIKVGQVWRGTQNPDVFVSVDGVLTDIFPPMITYSLMQPFGTIPAGEEYSLDATTFAMYYTRSAVPLAAMPGHSPFPATCKECGTMNEWADSSPDYVCGSCRSYKKMGGF
jgi:hypothetical protein